MTADWLPVGENEPKTHGVGDTLLISSVVREISQRYPDKKIIVKTRGPKEIFYNNPRVYRVEHGYWGEYEFWPHGRWRGMHQIQNLCESYGIHNADITPELFISDKERMVAEKSLQMLTGGKPAIMFCGAATHPERNWDNNKWADLIAMLSRKYEVFQMEETLRYDFESGDITEIYPAIPGARQELRGFGLRKLFAMMSVSRKYLGVNTGWMVAGCAFGYDNYTVLQNKTPFWMFPRNKNFVKEDDYATIRKTIEEDWMK
jgi:hypothetical protein